jgi:hypothetical protein
LDQYHKDINYWWRLLGEMFEGTDCFTKPYEIKCHFDNKYFYVRWNDSGWKIEKL